MRAPQHSRRVVVGVLVATLVVLAACQPVPLPPPEDGSTLIGCDAAGVRAELTTSSHLDPTCTYTAGFDITASDVTLDCQGATIAAPISANGAGILIHTPVEVAMDHVTVRNCRVEGFLNSIKVTRDGFRTLPDDGQEFAHPTTDIVIERTVVTGSRGVGIYVDGYVSGVTLRRNEIKGAGGSGIYLETGSKQSIVEGNQIVDNGYIENGPNGTKYKFSGIDFWFWGIGREGISVDGSYENTIRGNVFTRNSAGGIFMYKNCGEYPDRPRYFERRDPADHNLIQGNVFVGGREGIWVSSRMGENTLPMECTDEAYIDEPLRRVVRDHASHNVILGNQFVDVTYGVRVEDDDNDVIGNSFTASSPDHHAVIVGTPLRTEVLGEPVTRTKVVDNTSTIAGNPNPYRWVHGETESTVLGNTALGQTVGWCEGQTIPRQIFVMAIAVLPALADGSKPPTPDLTVATVGELPPCGG